MMAVWQALPAICMGTGMEKAKRNRRKSRGGAAVFVRRVLRLIKRQRKEAVIAAAGILLVCSAACVTWALLRSRSAARLADGIQPVEDVAAAPIQTEAPVEPLATDAFPEVNELVARYFRALQEGDEAALGELRDYTENKELLRIHENSSRIESYNDIVCYTKSGLEEDSFVVFARYEVKFAGIDATLPGVTPLYVRKNEEGRYYLHEMSQDAAAAQRAGQVAADEDVEALYDSVSREYQARLAEDETLAEYMEEYTHSMMAAVGEALEEQTEAAEAAREAAGAGSGSSAGQNAQPAPPASVQVPNSGSFTVSDTVNIRKIASEGADKIGVCYPGDTLEILMKQADGWTRVSYQGQTGYVRSDVLK